MKRQLSLRCVQFVYEPLMETQRRHIIPLVPFRTASIQKSARLRGSANKTTDEERLVYSTFTTRGNLRQEENPYLAIDADAIKELLARLQKLIGVRHQPVPGMDQPRESSEPSPSGTPCVRCCPSRIRAGEGRKACSRLHV